MAKKIGEILKFNLFISFYVLFSATLMAEVITEPGEWRDTAQPTIYLKCLSSSNESSLKKFCQISPDGANYELICPELSEVEVQLKKLDKSFYCYAKRDECIDPIPCAILEKVVLLPGGDLCQHGELTTERKCSREFTYRFDYLIDTSTEHKIVDQCCREVEIFARPGVRL